MIFLELIIEKAEQFKKCVDAIAVLIDEAHFVLENDTLTLKATDPSQISMIDFTMGKKAFKKFDVKEKMKLGTDISYLKQILSRTKSGDELEIKLDDKNNSLSLLFKGKSSRKFVMPLLDITSNEIPNPKIEFDAELTLKASVIQDALKDASLISTHVSLGADSKSFFVKANSSKGTVYNETLKNDETLKELNIKQESHSMFPLEYLSDMLKAASSDSDVKLFIKTNAPVKISYAIGEAEITYFLAPRIEQ